MNHLPFSFLLIATLLVSATSISAVDSTIATAPNTDSPSPAPSPTLSTIGCDGKCERRCANADYKERCMKYCGICCGKCEGCVPLSPYADKAECPCYHDLKNSKGKDKCP